MKKYVISTATSVCIVQELPDGRWLGHTSAGDMSIHAPSRFVRSENEVFDTAEQALEYIGYPVGKTVAGVYFGLPDELKNRA